MPSCVSAAFVGRAVDADRRGRLESLRQSEVEQLHARLRQHHVAGLQIAVDDALPVRLVESVGDLDAEAERLIERQRALRQPVRERLALEILHDEILDFALASDVVQRADVRMREGGDRLRLAFEPLARLGRRGQPARQHLDGDGPVEPGVERLVDLAHSSGADQAEDPIPAEHGIGAKGHAIGIVRGRRRRLLS